MERERSQQQKAKGVKTANVPHFEQRAAELSAVVAKQTITGQRIRRDTMQQCKVAALTGLS